VPFAVWTAGAVRRPSTACAYEGRWLLAGMMRLSLAMSASAESLRTENVEPDADAVSDSDVSQETRYCGEKGLTFDPEGAPTSGLAFACKPGSMAT